jgi:energy-coupling factor transport system ATP-binding protein
MSGQLKMDGRARAPRNADNVPAFIEARGLGHIYRLEDGRQIAALSDVDLTIERGEFVALIGANGSGKSTLAHHFNGLLQPTSGEVLVDGLSTGDPSHRWEIRKRVGMVFQNPDNQLVASTVEEDVAFGPENWALPPPEIRERVDEALEIVGLEDYRTTPPHMLSGGQKQLVAIAGALATRPACLVLDEPTSMLDPGGRSRVTETVHRLNAHEGLTIVLITQSMEEVASAQRVLALHAGHIVMDGPPEQIFAQGERLTAIGLGLPAAVEIAHHLRRQGVALGTSPIRISELARALGPRCPAQVRGNREQGVGRLC